MKTPLLLSVLMLGLIPGVYGQKPTITLTFTADKNGQNVSLNSILIENITREVDTTLYAPDTALVIDCLVGINENLSTGSGGFFLSQNYPNPFDSHTAIDVFLPETENLRIIVSNMLGRELLIRKYYLDHGNHSFTFYPGKEGLYFLSAHTDSQSQTIKMINTPRDSKQAYFGLEYRGMKSGFNNYKAGNEETNFVYYLGDLLKFTAFADEGERVISSSPTSDRTYQFNFTGISCPGTPTVSDIDGNVYNTVLIGEQCWMKENLRTTHYRNGTAIEYPGDDNLLWQSNNSGAYAWYNNDVNWKDSYGALYNWYAVNNQNGFCPAGFRVPTDSEWTQLVDYLGTNGFPNNTQTNGAGNALKSCRQVNSPHTGECNTSEHPRWSQSQVYNGFDAYGFSAFPAGGRYFNGDFSAMGSHTAWWSITEDYTQDVWTRHLYTYAGYLDRGPLVKRCGVSIRCIRDEMAPAYYQLNLTTDPMGAGTLIGAGEYKPGDNIDVLTTPNSGWEFVSWTDENGVVSVVPGFIYTMPARDVTLTANYAEEQGSFICGDTITDIDGYVYSTVVIGNQCWMAENLKTTRDAAGNSITRYCYNNNVSNCNWYGGLYNWETIMNGAGSSANNPSGVQGICPVGWHVPSDAEFSQLVDFLGGTLVAGGRMKSTRTTPDPHPRWFSPNTGANNESNWSGLPGGLRDYYDDFMDLEVTGFWWSATQSYSSSAWTRYLDYMDSQVVRNSNDKLFHFSVRCLKE